MRPLFDIPEVILHTFTGPLGRLLLFSPPCYFIAVFLWTCVDSNTALQSRVIWSTSATLSPILWNMYFRIIDQWQLYFGLTNPGITFKVMGKKHGHNGFGWEIFLFGFVFGFVFFRYFSVKLSEETNTDNKECCCFFFFKANDTKLRSDCYPVTLTLIILFMAQLGRSFPQG